MYRLLFQAQICGKPYPVNLPLERLTTRFFSERSVNACFLKFKLLSWLLSNNCRDVCMESTGKHWISVCNILETDCKIVLAHPKYVKAIRRKKTDKKDAKWIADIFEHDLVSGGFIPPADIRQLRDLVRYHKKLTNFTVGEKNHAQNCLTVSNFKLDSVFSDVLARLLQISSDTFSQIVGEAPRCVRFQNKTHESNR